MNSEELQEAFHSNDDLEGRALSAFLQGSMPRTSLRSRYPLSWFWRCSQISAC